MVHFCLIECSAYLLHVAQILTTLEFRSLWTASIGNEFRDDETDAFGEFFQSGLKLLAFDPKSASNLIQLENEFDRF